ncbi:reverse transcriptase domain-containing protein [Tanacetum coccineum]
MADQRTMVELLRAPTKGYAEAIVVRPILAEHFELKHSLINMMTSDQFFRLEKDNPHDHIRYVSAAAVNYNQGNSGYRPPSVANQIRPPGFAQPNVQNNQNRFSQPQGYNRGNNFKQDTSYQAPIQQNQVVPLSELEKIKKINEVNIKAMQAQINNVKNELRNEMQTLIQASMSNQTNELKNMMASFFQMNTASSSGSGSLPGNTIANPKGELKAITTRSGLVLDGPSVPMPPPFINPEEDERAEETLTDPELAEYTIKVPPPLVQKAKPTSLKNYVVHKRDPLHPNIPYPSRMHQEKQQEKDEVQIHKFWQMFKQLHINISLADALILIPKYQKMLKSLLSNKEKLLELANTPLNENCSAVILKKLPEKLGDPGKFLIPCGFSELKCKALADLGASINLMPLSVWKKLGLPELISTRMTLELANRTICTPAGIARDVFVPPTSFTTDAGELMDHLLCGGYQTQPFSIPSTSLQSVQLGSVGGLVQDSCLRSFL